MYNSSFFLSLASFVFSFFFTFFLSFFLNRHKDVVLLPFSNVTDESCFRLRLTVKYGCFPITYKTEKNLYETINCITIEDC